MTKFTVIKYVLMGLLANALIRVAVTRENILTVSSSIDVPAEAIRNIITPNTTMKIRTSITFTKFINDAHNHGQTTYYMFPTYLPADYDYYHERSGSRDDIQIIFYEPSIESSVGHVICVHLNHLDNKVIIYNSAYRNNVNPHRQVIAVLKKLYPSVTRIEFVRPGTLQPDDASCGFFSIAYATALIFGIDPKNLKLRLASSGDPLFFLRQHLEQILNQRRITPFPTVVLELTVSSEINVPASVIRDVITPYNTMSSRTIIIFTQCINDAYNHGQTFHDMLPIFPPKNYWEYSRRDESRDDIQIIYFELDPTKTGVGQFCCAHYNHLQNKLTVYVSSCDNDNQYQQALRIPLETLYPFIGSSPGGQIEFVRLGAIQHHKIPSGLVSIAVATALIFGIDPKDIQFRMASSGDPSFFLRQHLEQIFRQMRITPFPTELAVSRTVNVPEAVTEDLSTSHNTMKHETIMTFIKFANGVNRKGHKFDEMLPIFPPENYRKYSERDKSKDDIQILYSELDPTRKGVGQFSCAHYDHLQNKVTIYTSSCDNDEQYQHALTVALRILYPFVRNDRGGQIEFVELRTIPGYKVHSGLVSIGVATALMFGIDPIDLKFKSGPPEDPAFYLWEHLEEIFREGKITLFPTVLPNPTIIPKPNMPPVRPSQPKPPTQEEPTRPPVQSTQTPIQSTQTPVQSTQSRPGPQKRSAMPPVPPRQRKLSTEKKSPNQTEKSTKSSKKPKKTIFHIIGNIFKAMFGCS